jgi:hypothetical protein
MWIADLLFGNSLDLSGGINNSIHQRVPNTETQSQSMDKMINMQSKLISIPGNVLEDSDREHNSVNSASITEFPNNSFVLVTQRMSPDKRLQTLWRGTMKVIDHKQGEYTLLDLTTNKEKRYHSTQMIPFLFHPLWTNVSRKDCLEFFIETTHWWYQKIINLTIQSQMAWLWWNIEFMGTMGQFKRNGNPQYETNNTKQIQG